MIIRDFTDNDLYKFTTMNAVQKKFPNDEVVYRFTDSWNTVFPEGFECQVRKEFVSLGSLSLSAEAEEFMRKRCYYFDPVFIDLLKGFRFNPAEVSISQKGGKLDVEIKGLWYRTILWEVPVLAIISELYYKMTGQHAGNFESKAEAKSRALAEMKAELSEFGTRRRFSFDVQNRVIEILRDQPGSCMNGTSNVYLAMKHSLTPIGTYPHEWFMYHGAHYGYRIANELSLQNWVDVYHGSLGIALTDTYTTDNFFRSFNLKFSKLFDGVRWDSGDPFLFTDKAVEHYKKLRIAPESKTIVYSDALDLEKVKAIKKYAGGRVHDVYGIGTYLTNDTDARPLNIVIKIHSVKPEGHTDYIPAVKLSDAEGKHTGDPEEVRLCKGIIRMP